MAPLAGDHFAAILVPFFAATDKRYHGVNVLILGMAMRAFQSGVRAG
jgi:hypothetical protein